MEKHHILLDWQIVEFFTQYQNQQNKEEIETMDITTLLKRAIKQKQNLEIVYLRSEDQKSKRIITPKKVGTMEYQGKEFEGLEAFCHSMQEIRVFSVRKILSVEVVE
ncbi:MAG: WYL domain-containing protein [Candidatus Peribacteria bacterium]|nr:WYL domain-containing protein [Candidatus Peribacteria bacterium]